jgi:hypothetical protein
MKLNKFKTEILQKNRVYIEFNEPITEEDYHDLSLFMTFFGTKKAKRKLSIDFKRNPLRITGLKTYTKTWAAFLKHINQDAMKWYNSVRDRPIVNLEELEMFLDLFKKATIIKEA